MTHGRCLCVCCMCSVMSEGMCETFTQVRHASGGLVGGIENAIQNVMLYTTDTRLGTLQPGK